MIHVFDKSDADYLQWMTDHPRGFVLNTKRPANQAYAMLHRSNCSHIRSLRNGEVQSCFTEHGWVKFCSEDLQGLLASIFDHKSAPLVSVARCKACNVLEQDVVIERHALHFVGNTEKTSTLKIDPIEHDPLARALCIQRHGSSCSVCNIDMSVRYGALGSGFIEVHHQRSTTAAELGREPDPLRDLYPVCPNCHAMLHRGREIPLTVNELKTAMRKISARRNDMLMDI
jgi:predicted HNH restriction endonuclease